MTTLETLVPSLKVCQQLRGAGFPQSTIFKWCRLTGTEKYSLNTDAENYYVPAEEVCSAPTDGELDEWLLCNGFDNILVKNESADGENAVGISCIHSDGRDFEAHEATEIVARSALVLQALP